jgi:hypothetical protein
VTWFVGLDAELSTSASLTAAAVKTTDTALALSSSAAQTALVNRTTDTSVAQEVIASQLTAVARNATFEIDLATSSSITATATRIVEYVKAENYGVQVYSDSKYPRLVLSGLPIGGLSPRAPNFVASIWARRSQTGPVFTNIWSPGNTDPMIQTNLALIIDGDNIRFRSTLDADEPGATWTNIAPNDTEWHHYLFQTPTDNQHRLWIDGVYQGQRSLFLTNDSEFNNGQYLRLGTGIQPIPDYDESTNVQNNLGLAQVWMGLVNEGSFNDRYFYDGGYVELNDDGRGAFDRLPAPYIYSRLNKPYGDVYFVGEYTTAEKSASEALEIPNLSAFTKFTASASAVLVYTIEINSLTQISATGYKQVEMSAALTSSASITTVIGSRKPASSALASEATQSAQAVKTARESSTQSSEFTITAEVGDLDSASASLTSEFSLEALGTAIDPIRASADLSSDFTVSAQGTAFSGFASSQAADFTISAEATVIPPVRITADLSLDSTLTATIGSIEQNIALIVSSGALTAEISVIKQTSASESALATLTAQAQRQFRTTSANLNAGAFSITAGDVINLDPALTLVIKSESRLFKILPESREYLVKGESRTFIVNKG